MSRCDSVYQFTAVDAVECHMKFPSIKKIASAMGPVVKIL